MSTCGHEQLLLNPSNRMAANSCAFEKHANARRSLHDTRKTQIWELVSKHHVRLGIPPLRGQEIGQFRVSVHGRDMAAKQGDTEVQTEGQTMLDGSL